MTHPLAGRTCRVVGNHNYVGMEGTVIDGYAGLLGSPAGMGAGRIGTANELVYLLLIQVTNVPRHMTPDIKDRLLAVPAIHVKIEPARADPMSVPDEGPRTNTLAIVDALAKAGIEIGRRRETWRGGMAAPEIVIDPMDRNTAAIELGVAMKACARRPPPTQVRWTCSCGAHGDWTDDDTAAASAFAHTQQPPGFAATPSSPVRHEIQMQVR